MKKPVQWRVSISIIIKGNFDIRLIAILRLINAGIRFLGLAVKFLEVIMFMAIHVAYNMYRHTICHIPYTVYELSFGELTHFRTINFIKVLKTSKNDIDR